MHAEVKAIQANAILLWPTWEPTHPADELQWFTVYIGVLDEAGADSFQVAVATPQGLKQRRSKTPFVGLVVPTFTPETVEDTIRAFVAGVEAPTWRGIAEQLAPTMRWQFTDYRP